MVMRKVDKSIWVLESASVFSNSFLASGRCFQFILWELKNLLDNTRKGQANGATFNRFRELLELRFLSFNANMNT